MVFGLFPVFEQIGNHFVHFLGRGNFLCEPFCFLVNQGFQIFRFFRVALKAHGHAVAGIGFPGRRSLNVYAVGASFFFPDVFGVP